MSATVTPFTAGDYRTDLKPVWCAGCGDFGVLTALYRAMAEQQWKPWETVVISGIGCSSRLPGYVSTYGFNTVHGRALPLATGVKVARPDLHVVAVGGDGDGFAIGGNHFLHSCRRNLDVTYILMDNEIYGLTKGQSAPTTPSGDKTKSTYYGNPEPSFDPCEVAISVGATWVGRAFSGDVKGTVELMSKALAHHGFGFLNVMSPCVTWRGEDQFKSFKAKSRPLPEGHDKTSRAAALQFTRETEIMSLGVLYEVKAPSLIDRLAEIQTRARASRTKEPTTDEIVRSFLPKL
ncbi:MAG TPA: 2-oxoacid:ferredoxin oxidoreductase subunit beta [Thermoanaerobaculia bacterium]|nr:2-oxoacid:ferredoxin oxidoreductase subunit beta [Thermoanaerobaculia bacterium]